MTDPRREVVAQALYDKMPHTEGPEYLEGFPINGRENKSREYSWAELARNDLDLVKEWYYELAEAAIRAMDQLHETNHRS